MRPMLGTIILGFRFFPFITLNISCHCLLDCRVSAERSAVKQIGFPLYVTCCFSLAAFNIPSLCLVFVSLISMCLGVFLLGFILYGTLHDSCIWLTNSFSMLGKFSTVISSKIFSYHFLFFCEPYIFNVGAFDIVPEVSDSVLFILFTLFCSSEVISTVLSSSSLIYSSASGILLLIPSWSCGFNL